jgi:hypothetical protein
VTASFEVGEEIAYKYEGVLCPGETGVPFEDGSYEGEVTMAGSGGINIDVG